LKLPGPVPAGKKIKCPRCQIIFAAWGRDSASPGAEQEGPPTRSEADPHEAPTEEYAGAREHRQAVRPPRTGDDYAARAEQTPDADLDIPRIRKKRPPQKSGSGLLVGLILGGILLLLGAGAFAAWVWPGFLRAGVKSSNGDENLLAYAPKKSVFFYAADMAAVKKVFPVTDAERNQWRTVMAMMNTGVMPMQLFEVLMDSQEFVMTGVGLPGGFIVILKTTKAYTQDEMAKRFNVTEPLTSRGKIYYKVPSRAPMGMGQGVGQGMGGRQPMIGPRPIGMAPPQFIGMPTDRVLVFVLGSEELIQEAIDSDGSEVRLPAETQAVIDPVKKTPFWFAGLLDDSTRQMVNLFVQMAANMPRPVADALQQLKSVVGSVSVGDRIQFKMSATFTGDAIARNVTDSLRDAWTKQGKPALALGGAILPPDFKDLVTEFTNSLTFTTQGATASLSCQVSRQALEKASRGAQQQFQKQMGGARMQMPMPMRPNRPNMPNRPNAPRLPR
jgi:hypothetical protein